MKTVDEIYTDYMESEEGKTFSFVVESLCCENEQAVMHNCLKHAIADTAIAILKSVNEE